MSFFAEYNPIAVGRRVFTPSRPGIPDDRAVQRTQLLRTAFGLVAIAGLIVYYRLANSVQGALEDRFDDSWINALVLSATLPVAIVVFIAAASPGRRGLLLRRALKPLGAALALFGGMFTFALAMAPELAGVRGLAGPATPVVNIVAGFFLILWMVPFVVYGITMSLVHVFRTADIHEWLPPLLATVLAWEMAVLGVFNGAYQGVPGSVRALYLLGGPVSVTLVSIWECYRLHTRYGVRWRDALRGSR
jgi:hypothetical protein